jgi:O-succinylbenzoic acid--CoA ligase
MRDWLAVRADATPTATALRAFGPLDTDRSYAELDDCVETLAGRLAGAGVGVDDAVAICADTRPAFVRIAHATQRLGAVLVPINTRLTPAEIEGQLDRVAPSAVLCERDTEAAVAEAADAEVLSLDDSGKARPLSDVSPRRFDLPEWEPDDPMAVLFTSGTTGDPKGVLLTLGNVLASATASAFRLGLRGDDCWHVPLPMYHMGGLAPVYRSVLYGTALSIQRGFDPERTREALAGASTVSLVPTMLERLLDSGSVPPLRFVLLGGAPCPPELLERAQKRAIPVAPTYGMTETASGIATARPEEARSHPGSVGHPHMFAEVSILDEAGVPREAGETGEIVISGPMVTPGYLDGDVTADQFINGGIRTGDRGYRDEAGRLYVTGRADETILTGGENVDPAEVVSVLRTHPGVDDCAVVGLDDDDWGERVAALVVPADDADPSASALETHSQGRLAGYKTPRTIEFAADLPRTASGTVDRAAVVDRLADDG